MSARLPQLSQYSDMVAGNFCFRSEWGNYMGQITLLSASLNLAEVKCSPEEWLECSSH